MSLHSNRSSVSRRPVGGQAGANFGQPSSPAPSHVSKSTSVSSGPIQYDVLVGPDIPFRLANSPAVPPIDAPVMGNDASFNVNQDRTVLETTHFSPPQAEGNPLNAPPPSSGPPADGYFVGAPSNVPSWEPPSVETPDLGHSTLEVVPEAYLNNFWSPEPAPALAPEPVSNSQQTKTNVVRTGWAIASPEPLPSQAPAPQSPGTEAFSPLSMPTMAPAAMPPPLFSNPNAMHTPSPMTPSSVSTVDRTPPPSLATKVPSRMPSNATPPVLHLNQPRGVELASYASVCCQCANGTPTWSLT